MYGPNNYTFTKQEVARYVCNDCGTNVVKAGDFCMLRPAIWEKQFKLGWDDNLCLKCVERRLGRQLKFMDFSTISYVRGYPPSAALMARYGGEPQPVKKKKPTKKRKAK